MERRNFLKQSTLASASLIGFSSLQAAPKTERIKTEKPFHLNYAFHDGMFKNSAGNDFIDQIKFAYDMGFRSIEDNGMMSRPSE